MHYCYIQLETMLLQASFGEAQRYLTSQGVNSPALAEKASKASSAAEGAFNQAKPSLTSSLTSISTRDPGTLAEYALGAIAVYYLVYSCTLPAHPRLQVSEG